MNMNMNINFDILKPKRLLSGLLGICMVFSFAALKSCKTEKLTPKKAIESHSVKMLVADGKTKEALQILIDGGNKDALLLKNRFEDAEKEWKAGLIPYEEWAIAQNRINYSILEFTAKEPTNGSTQTNGIVKETKKVEFTVETKTKIKELVQQNKTEDALRLYKDSTDDFILLLARLTNTKRQLDLGMITEKDFETVKQQIDLGILYLLEEK